ncbi:uncharacterized protein [Clytia hemisphaerica]
MSGVQMTIRCDTIKSALKNFIVPIVVDRYFVISFRCLWDVFDEDLEKANYNLENKREEMETIIKRFDEVMLYFSCLCGMKVSDMRHKLIKRKRQEEERREAPLDSDEDYQSYEIDGEKTVIPGISYWIAISSTRGGANKIEAEICKRIMLAGLNVSDCKEIIVRGKGTYTTLVAYSRLLFQVLKDHNNRGVCSRALRYHYEAVRAAAVKRKITLIENPEFRDPLADERPMARVVLTKNLANDVRGLMLGAIQNIKFTKIELETIDETSSSVSPPSVAKFIPTDPLCIAADELHRFMKKKHYSICKGRVYKKAQDSEFTYVNLQGIEEFILWALGQNQVANACASHVSSLIRVLSKPTCRLIQPIQIMYNYIECLPAGTIFVISQKKFIKVRSFPSNTSPRAFVKYTYRKDRVPYPKPFLDGNQI